MIIINNILIHENIYFEMYDGVLIMQFSYTLYYKDNNDIHL